jgi:hypothetical protein
MLSFLDLERIFLNNHDISDGGIATLQQAMKSQKIFHITSVLSSDSAAFRYLVEERGRELVTLSQMDFDAVITPGQTALFKQVERVTGLPFTGILGVRPNEHEGTTMASLEM